jgi:HK97 family phage major capsid protein
MKSSHSTADDFSIAALIRSMTAETWGKAASHEHNVHERLVAAYGPCKTMRSARIPHEALSRDMTVASASGGGYLVGTQNAGYLPTLQPASVVLKLGAGTYDAGKGFATFPKGTAGVVTTWLADENSPISETQPTFGQIAAAPKIVAALCEVSRQSLIQSNAEAVIRAEFRRATGAELDRAVLNGSGASGQPLGIIATSGIGAFTGASLNRSALTNAQLDVGTANAAGNSRGYVTTPTIANTLQNRADTIFTTTPVWQGAAADGSIIGERALSTNGMPAATMVYGEWSHVTVVSWGTMEIAVDPFSKFSQGIVAVRLLMVVDSVVTNASGFTLATTIT